MPRVSAPWVLLPAWLVMAACSPHSLRIGKCSARGRGGPAPLTLPLTPELGWAMGRHRAEPGFWCWDQSCSEGPGACPRLSWTLGEAVRGCGRLGQGVPPKKPSADGAGPEPRLTVPLAGVAPPSHCTEGWPHCSLLDVVVAVRCPLKAGHAVPSAPSLGGRLGSP